MHCDLDLWPFDLKIYRAHPWLMGSLYVKFHDDRCKGKAVMCRKPKCGRQTDGQTDMVIPVYPPNFVAGGIIMQQWDYRTDINYAWTDIKAQLNQQIHTILYYSLVKTGYRLGVCHSWFHLYWLMWAVRHTLKGRTTKWKIFDQNGTRTHYLSLTRLVF